VDHKSAGKSVFDLDQLKKHICVLWHAGSTLEPANKELAEINPVPRLPASLGDDRLLSCGVKIYMNGSGRPRTGWVYDDWLRNAMTPSQVQAPAIGATRELTPPFTKRWFASFTATASPSAPVPWAITRVVGDNRSTNPTAI